MDVKIEAEKEKCLCLEAVTEMLKLRNSIERAVSPITQRYGLTPMQAATLYFIATNSESTVGELFRALELNQGNASSMCKRLESEGYILRRRSTEDERRVVLAVTGRGAEAVSSIGREASKLLPSYADMTLEERAKITDSLRTLKDFAGRLSDTLMNNEEENTNA